MNDNLYREEILENYKNPQNFGKLSSFNASSKQLNPFCGDEVEIYVRWDKGDTRDRGGKWVRDVAFEGRGCAISIAAASMLTDFAKGKTKKELTKFSEKDMLNLLQVEISETRKKCAFLALAVLKDILYAAKSKS